MKLLFSFTAVQEAEPCRNDSFFGIATWKTIFDIVEVLHHGQIITNSRISSQSFWEFAVCDSTHLGCSCSTAEEGGAVSMQIGIGSGSCGTSLPRESRPGLQHQMGAKPQWHPSHLQTHSAWVQTHKHKIKLCFF